MDRPFQVLLIGNSHEPDGYNIFHQIYGDNPAVNLISFGTINKCEIEVTAQGPVSTVSHRRCAERTALLNQIKGLGFSDAYAVTN